VIVCVIAMVVMTCAVSAEVAERSLSSHASAKAAAMSVINAAKVDVAAEQQPTQADVDKKCAFCYNSGEFKGPAPAVDPTLSPARQAILTTAQSYMHQVLACGGVGGQKFGADKLVDIYQTSLQSGWNAATMEKSVRTKAGQWNGPWSWCAIFATAMVRKAGITDLNWGIGKMVGRTVIPGTVGMQPGDILYWSGGLQHHSILEAIDGNYVYSIDGMQNCDGIYRTRKLKSKIAGYYKTVN